MSECTRYADDLKALVDGELSLLRRCVIERHVAGCAECKGEVAAMEQIGRGLRMQEPAPLDAALRARILAAIPEPSGPARRPMPRRLSFAVAGSLCAIAALIIVFRPVTTSFITTGPSEVMPQSAPAASAPLAASAGQQKAYERSKATKRSESQESVSRPETLAGVNPRISADVPASAPRRVASAAARPVPPAVSTGRAAVAAPLAKPSLRFDEHAAVEQRNSLLFGTQRGGTPLPAETQPFSRSRDSLSTDYTATTRLPQGQNAPSKPSTESVLSTGKDVSKSLGAIRGGGAVSSSGVAANGAIPSGGGGGGFGNAGAGGFGGFGGGAAAAKAPAPAGPAGLPALREGVRTGENRQSGADDRVSNRAARPQALADGNQGVTAPVEQSSPMSAVLSLSVTNVPEKRAAVDKLVRENRGVLLNEQLAEKGDRAEDGEAVLRVQVEPVKFYRMLDQLGKLGDVTTKLVPDPENQPERGPYSYMDSVQLQRSNKEQEATRRPGQLEMKQETQLRAQARRYPAPVVGGRLGASIRGRMPVATITVKLREKRAEGQGAASQTAPAAQKR